MIGAGHLTAPRAVHIIKMIGPSRHSAAGCELGHSHRRRGEDEVCLDLPQELCEWERPVSRFERGEVELEPALKRFAPEAHQPEHARLVAGRPGHQRNMGKLSAGHRHGDWGFQPRAIDNGSKIGSSGVTAHHFGDG